MLARVKHLGCALALSLMAGAAQASICSLMQAGAQCVINWDASGLGTGPFDATANDLFGAFNPPLTWSWFDGLNATGTLFASGGPADWYALYDLIPGSAASLWDDGRASLLVTLATDRPTGLSKFSLVFTDSSNTGRVVLGTAGTLTAVPTPDSLSLVAAALLGAGAGTVRRFRRPAPTPAA